MDTIYLVSLLVGGFFVLLSIFGGGDAEADVDADFDADFDTDLEADFDADADYDTDFDADADAGFEAGPGLIDLFTVRALFLFAAFFGLTGVLLSWAGTEEPLAAILSVLTGLVVGLGGNYAIKRVGYRSVSSAVRTRDLQGITGRVMVPFEAGEVGKIRLVARGNRMQLMARSFEEAGGAFQPGEEVVVIRMEGAVAEVVKPE